MTQTPQTIMVAAFCDGGAGSIYTGNWIARMNAEGQLSFLSTTRQDGETAAEAAVRCICSELWPDCPLDVQDFTLVGHNKRINTKLFKLNWLVPLAEINMVECVLSSNRAPGAYPLGMTKMSRKALAKAPIFGRYMRNRQNTEQLYA